MSPRGTAACLLLLVLLTAVPQCGSTACPTTQGECHQHCQARECGSAGWT
eukprot:gene44695-59752_t